jgi:catechol 2,3-dioxygenase-like lactoylglutathione lyase family enzyme
MPLAVQSLDHVTLVVKDLARTRRFYVDVLGMRQVPRPNFSFAGDWYQAGDTQIHIILEAEGSGPAGTGKEPHSRSRHFAFLVDSAEAAHRQLLEQGIPIVSPPKMRPDGAVQVFVHDPDGHLVELCSPPVK